MGKFETILTVVQTVAFVAAHILLILGLYASIKDMNYINKDDPQEEEAHSKAAFKKGMILIGCGVAVYALSRFCENYILMTEENYGIAIIMLQSLWEGVRDRGFLLLFPFIIRQWRRTARRKALIDK